MTAIIKYKQIANPFFDKDLRQMLKWFVDIKLAVNVEKSDAMFFSIKATTRIFLVSKSLT